MFCLAYLKIHISRSSTNSSSSYSIEKFRVLPNPSKPPTKSAITADASLCINPMFYFVKFSLTIIFIIFMKTNLDNLLYFHVC
jgi:hypothetical protein